MWFRKEGYIQRESNHVVLLIVLEKFKFIFIVLAKRTETAGESTKEGNFNKFLGLLCRLLQNDELSK